MASIKADTPSEGTNSPTVETREALLAAFGLSPDVPWRTLARSDRSTHFVTVEARPHVLRVFRSEHLASTEDEVWVTEALRAVGFCDVPTFEPLKSGRNWSCHWRDNGLTTMYGFIPGTSPQWLDDRQFVAVVRFMERFQRALDQLPLAGQLGRAFARTEAALERARSSTLLGAASRSLRDFAEARSTADVLRCIADESPSVVHGDLHAGNLVWARPDRLVGLIDFASTGYGSRTLDIAALATGTCFINEELRLDRLATIVSALAPWMAIGDPHELVDVLALTSIAFFLEVNSACADPAGAEWRDARRARAILARRSEIVSAVGGGS